MQEVELLFEPKSVVLIGSSKIHEKVGMTSPEMYENVAYNMTKFFKGETHILDVEGRKGRKKLEKLPKTPDLAVVMLPPKLSLRHAENCAKNGVKAVIILTGGYKSRQRQQLIQLRTEYDTRILGPNAILGVLNTTNGLNTTFERGLMPPKGNISVISQSGGVGACLLDWACYYEIGVAKFAFVGDKVDVDDVDLLRYFAKDPQTRVICLYMEGIERGREFVETAREIVRTKPILALKGGATKEAARRALSHTASIAGSDTIFNAALRKAGAIRVEDMEELFNAAIALSKQPPLRGDKIAIVSNVGGPAILAADAIVKNQLKLANLTVETIQKIEQRYPGVEALNPIDLIADAQAERYSFVLNKVLSDPNVDGVMIINMLKSCYFKPEDALVIAQTARQYKDKPVVDVSAGGEDFELIRKVLRDTDIPVYNLPEKGAKALRVLRTYQKVTKSLHEY